MIFVAVTGQRDNVGDSLLRRPMLGVSHGLGPRHVLVGEDALDYETNLGIAPADVLYSSRAKWILALLRAVAVGRAHLFLNSGEIVVGPRFLLDRIMLLPLVLLIRLRRGVVVQSGIGIRNPRIRPHRVLAWILRRFTLVTWRDERSKATVRVGRVAPDWALATGTTGELIAERYNERAWRERGPAGEAPPRRIAIALRGDHPVPSAAWVESVRSWLRENGAEALAVCQVRRDSDRAVWLSRALECELVSWPAQVTHAQQEARVREVYKECTWVASDRLHVMLAAYTEGCIPLDLVPDNGGKIRRTMLAFGADVATATPHSLAALEEDQQRLLAVIGTARESLQQFTMDARNLMAG